MDIKNIVPSVKRTVSPEFCSDLKPIEYSHRSSIPSRSALFSAQRNFGNMARFPGNHGSQFPQNSANAKNLSQKNRCEIRNHDTNQHISFISVDDTAPCDESCVFEQSNIETQINIKDEPPYPLLMLSNIERTFPVSLPNVSMQPEEPPSFRTFNDDCESDSNSPRNSLFIPSSMPATRATTAANQTCLSVGGVLPTVSFASEVVLDSPISLGKEVMKSSSLKKTSRMPSSRQTTLVCLSENSVSTSHPFSSSALQHQRQISTSLIHDMAGCPLSVNLSLNTISPPVVSHEVINPSKLSKLPSSTVMSSTSMLFDDSLMNENDIMNADASRLTSPSTSFPDKTFQRFKRSRDNNEVTFATPAQGLRADRKLPSFSPPTTILPSLEDNSKKEILTQHLSQTKIDVQGMSQKWSVITVDAFSENSFSISACHNPSPYLISNPDPLSFSNSLKSKSRDTLPSTRSDPLPVPSHTLNKSRCSSRAGGFRIMRSSFSLPSHLMTSTITTNSTLPTGGHSSTGKEECSTGKHVFFRHNLHEDSRFFTHACDAMETAPPLRPFTTVTTTDSHANVNSIFSSANSRLTRPKTHLSRSIHQNDMSLRYMNTHMKLMMKSLSKKSFESEANNNTTTCFRNCASLSSFDSVGEKKCILQHGKKVLFEEGKYKQRDLEQIENMFLDREKISSPSSSSSSSKIEFANSETSKIVEMEIQLASSPITDSPLDLEGTVIDLKQIHSSENENRSQIENSIGDANILQQEVTISNNALENPHDIIFVKYSSKETHLRRKKKHDACEKTTSTSNSTSQKKIIEPMLSLGSGTLFPKKKIGNLKTPCIELTSTSPSQKHMINPHPLGYKPILRPLPSEGCEIPKNVVLGVAGLRGKSAVME